MDYLYLVIMPTMMADVHLSSNDGTAHEISNPPPAEGKKRKGRGKTTGLSIQKKRKDSDNEKLKDTFQLQDSQHNRDTVLKTANNLYKYRRSRLHDHFKKYATKDECLQNMPADVNEVEWKFLVEYFNSDTFKRNTSTRKEPNVQKLWELTHMKNGHWVNDASAEVNVVGETLSYCRGQGSGANSTSRRSMNGIQEKLQAQQQEVEEERRKRESVECQLKEVKIQLEEERKNREAMVHDQKLLKQSMMVLASHIQDGVSIAILSIISNLSGSNDASCSRLMDDVTGEHE